MTLSELDRMIDALENSSPTFGNCQKLASLYVCRDYFSKRTIKGQNKENTDESTESKNI